MAIQCRSDIIKRESSATIKAAPAVYPQSEPAKPKNIIEMDCRGLEFTEFKPDVGHAPSWNDPFVADYDGQGDWQAVGTESGTKFTGIDLGEGEWFDYDEKAGDEVSIKDIKWEIRRA